MTGLILNFKRLVIVLHSRCETGLNVLMKHPNTLRINAVEFHIPISLRTHSDI